MKKDKFLTAREKKIKSVKEKADTLYNNLSKKVVDLIFTPLKPDPIAIGFGIRILVQII